MKNIFFIVCMAFLAPAVFASQQNDTERSVLDGMVYLEGRGLANAFLFAAEWPLIAQQEHHDHPKAFAATIPFVLLTHLGGRLFSGISDMVFMPVAYAVSRYDDAIPVGYGWGEFPWQEGAQK